MAKHRPQTQKVFIRPRDNPFLETAHWLQMGACTLVNHIFVYSPRGRKRDCTSHSADAVQSC